jgi:hypothetical protein
MGNIINIAIYVALGAVTLTLGFGLFSLYRGGEAGRSNSNRLMRLRVALQAVTIVLLCVGMWWKSTHAG